MQGEHLLVCLAYTPRHLYRSILEEIALEQRLLMEGVENATTDRIDEIFMLGGGSNSPFGVQVYPMFWGGK